MSILCSLFGHQPPDQKGKMGYEYADKVCDFYTDGILRVHANVYSTCPRCKKQFRLCKIHVPKVKS